MARTVSDVLVQALSDSGVDTVFGLHGNGINGLIEALRTAREKIRYVNVRHEETAALTGGAYGKFTARLCVCFSLHRERVLPARRRRDGKLTAGAATVAGLAALEPHASQAVGPVLSALQDIVAAVAGAVMSLLAWVRKVW